jgi:hypothetical protein
MTKAGLSVRLKAATPIALDITLDCAPGELLAIIGRHIAAVLGWCFRIMRCFRI